MGYIGHLNKAGHHTQTSPRWPSNAVMPTLLTACPWGTGSVTGRPRWGATPAEKRGNRHLGRLPMRNGSRQGKAQPCESANSCIYNVCHTAPAYERPPFAETFCGKVSLAMLAGLTASSHVTCLLVWSPSRGSGMIGFREGTPERDLTRGGAAVTFKEVLAQVIDWLQQDKRLSYRALKRQFALDDDYLNDLTMELIEVRRVAVDEDGWVLVWTGGADAPPSPLPTSSSNMAKADSVG
jgi:hypothetical protein